MFASFLIARRFRGKRAASCAALLISLSANVLADGPADNLAAEVRPVPPVGIELPESVKSDLLTKVKRVRELTSGLEVEGVRVDSRLGPRFDANMKAQIEVISRAVELAIEQSMFYTDKEFTMANDLLALAERRAQAAAAGKSAAQLLELTIPKPANKAPADNKNSAGVGSSPRLLAGGYRSLIDGSTQPYGIVLPADWQAGSTKPLRLDVWLHGRGEKVSEVAFLHQRLNQAGEFTPPDTLVLHPYGRYCNAFKFAGEIDVLEAIENIKKLYPIDESRIVIRGFSMGGAGCWQMAVHYPQLWAAANPGAGFCETIEFLRVFQKEGFKPTDYQRKLLHWYDCPDWTNNLRSVPTVAYSGEIDNQKQAADVMEAAFKLRGMSLPHVIGPQTAHKILAESKPILQEQIDAALKTGLVAVPKTIDLTTYMLRYHELAWLSIEGLNKHWEESIVHAELGNQSLSIQSKNVTRIKLQFAKTQFPFATDKPVKLEVDAQPLVADFNTTDQNISLWLIKDARGMWQTSADAGIKLNSTVKRPGLTGPIDDAFMDPFIWVPPAVATDASSAEPAWIAAEYKHATQEWRRHFRGDIVSKTELTDADIANNNLIVFGTPATNPLLAKVLSSLPLEWTATKLKMNGTEYDATTHVPVLIYPNPLNPNRYIVINSGFTFREFAYLNNARQIAMLPDWAVVDVTAGANSVDPGKVVSAGFFDEQWR